jgi:hypothetical protein
VVDVALSGAALASALAVGQLAQGPVDTIQLRAHRVAATGRRWVVESRRAARVRWGLQ